MRVVDKTKLKFEELDKFELICKQQGKNVYDVLDQLIKEYNKKYDKDYQDALESFWEN